MTVWHKIKNIFSRPVARAPGKAIRREENRTAVRKRQRMMEGFIWSERMAYAKACTIRDLSITGARIDLLDGDVKTHMLVGTMTLYLPSDKREIDCQLMWRSGRQVGLRFLGSYRAPTRRYGGR